MKKKELILIASIYDILERKIECPNKLDEELIKEFIKDSEYLIKREKLFSIKCANEGIRLKNEFPRKTRREIIQLALQRIEES